MNEYSDEKLVAASCNGDIDAYAKLVEKYYRDIFLTCLGVSGNVDDAEDAAQETILKGFREIYGLRDTCRFRLWITKIARNLSLNNLNRKRRTRQLLKARSDRVFREPKSNDELQLAIEKLSPDLRQPLVMYYFDGQNVKKIAEDLSISTSAVYLKLREAIKVLHRLLAG